MVAQSAETESAPRRGDLRREAIQQAAIEEFSTAGIAGASMSRIAAAAGVSRPALYQYFDNREDLFASAFIALFDTHVGRALDALSGPGSTEARLDGFLQRFDGDMWERMAASPHMDEIGQAKTGEVAMAVYERITRLRSGLADQLVELSPGNTKADKARRAEWALSLIHI